MSNSIKLYRGTLATMPILNQAVLGFTTDTLNLYFGDGTINHPIYSDNNLPPVISRALTGYSEATASRVLAATDTILSGFEVLEYRISLNESKVGITSGQSSAIIANTAKVSDINHMVYPGAGIALSTGTAWGTSIVDNSANWNTAYGWNVPANYLPLTGGTLSGSLTTPRLLVGATVSTAIAELTINGDLDLWGESYAVNTDVGGLLYHPTEGGIAGTKWFIRFDLTDGASYPYLTNRASNGAVVIKTGSLAGGTENEHFRIKGGDNVVDTYFTNTNVGIGTTSPGAKLEITGGSVLISNSDGYQLKDTGGSNRYGLGYFGTDNLTLTNRATGGDLILMANSGTAGGEIEGLRIQSITGNVFVGYTADPTSGNKFAVNGNGYFVGTFTASSIIKGGGTSSQFLKADGSVDSTAYLSSTGGTLSGSLHVYNDLNIVSNNSASTYNSYLQLNSTQSGSRAQGIHFYNSYSQISYWLGTTYPYGKFQLRYKPLSTGLDSNMVRTDASSTSSLLFGISPAGNMNVAGTLTVSTIADAIGNFITYGAGGVLSYRTATEVLSDIGGQPKTIATPLIGKKNLDDVFKTSLIKNLEADNTLPTSDYTGRIRPIATQMLLIAMPTTSITGEIFTTGTALDVVISLAHVNLDNTVAPVITSSDGLTTFTATTDYTIDYAAGTITPLSTGTMVISTGYLIDYTYFTLNVNTYTIANVPYIKDLIENPTNWVFWDMTIQPQPDTVAMKCLSIVYVGISGTYSNCYTITTNSAIVNATVGDSMATLSFKAYYYSNSTILFPKGTVSTDFNYTYTNNLSYVWKTTNGIYHGIVLGVNKGLAIYTYFTMHHYTSNSLLGTWTDQQAGSAADLFDSILPSTYVAYNMWVNGNRMPGEDGMHYMVGDVNKSDGTSDLAAVVFSDNLSYKRFIALNTSGYTWNGGMNGWTSTTFYKGEYLISVQDGALTGGSRIVLKANNLDGVFSLHSVITVYSDTDVIHPGSMFSQDIANGVLYVFNNELYYFSSGASNDITSGNYNNHEVFLWKYSDTDNNWNLVVTPCIVALHGDTANYGTQYTWGQDHCGVIVPLQLNEDDGRLYMAMGYEAGTNTYQGTIGYINLK